MRRLVTWIAGGLGVAALLRQLLRRQPVPPPAAPPAADPADELRAKLEQARGAADDRDEFDAAEGTPVDLVERPPEAQPVDEIEQPVDEIEQAETPDATPAPDDGERQRSLDERRRAVHDKAQQALGDMRGDTDDE